MTKFPQTKEEYIELGYEVAVIVAGSGKYGEFHKMDAGDWTLKKGMHIIPIKTAENALARYEEGAGAAPCRLCFPKGKAKGKANGDGS